MCPPGRGEAGVHLQVQSSRALSRRLVLSPAQPARPRGMPWFVRLFPAVSTNRLRPLPGVSSRARTAAQSRLSPQAMSWPERQSCPWTQHLSLRRTPSADRVGNRGASLRLAEIPELVQTPQPGTRHQILSPPCPKLLASPGRREEASVQHLLGLPGQGVSRYYLCWAGA